MASHFYGSYFSSFSFYGNYGGPGWTNGTTFQAGGPDTWQEPIDDLDAAFKEHDTAYWFSDKKFSETGDPQAMWADIVKADTTLLKDMANIPHSPGWLPNAPASWSEKDTAKDAATTAFTGKLLYDYAMYGAFSISIPDGALEAYLRSPANFPINIVVNTAFLLAYKWVRPADPLVLDLDGDGIERCALPGHADAESHTDRGGWKAHSLESGDESDGGDQDREEAGDRVLVESDSAGGE